MSYLKQSRPRKFKNKYSIAIDAMLAVIITAIILTFIITVFLFFSHHSQNSNVNISYSQMIKKSF